MDCLILRWLFKEIRSFTYNRLCWKSISFKSATLDQHINLDQDIIADMEISSPCYTWKQRVGKQVTCGFQVGIFNFEM